MGRFIQLNMALTDKCLTSTDVKDCIPHDYVFIDNNLCKLKPYHQIVKSASDIIQWLSQGEDPYFLLEFIDKTHLSPSWYEVQLCMHSSHKRSYAKFYFDTDAGFNETDALPIPTENGHLSRRIFRLAKVAHNIRFDPKETEGTFSIETLCFDKISEDQAKNDMLQRLISHDPDLAEMNTDDAWHLIVSGAKAVKQQPLEHLLSRYNESYISRPGTIAYEEWIETVEAASLPTPETVQATLERMANKPTISFVMPVYNTPEIYLRACIDSVLAQSYPHWELCIADDNSSLDRVREVLREYEHLDNRIRVVYRQENGHISRASNSALDIATGEYIALLDHDDALPEYALYFMALAIHENPDAQIVYSDEDKLDAKGQRFDPHFKSDWNPDLFYSQNYVSHLGVYRRDLLGRVGGFRPGVEGSQDQDLLLRCLPHVGHDQIIHIPRVLYHWRTVEGSTALASGEKSYTTDAGIRALKDHFMENGPQGIEVVAGLVPNTYRALWPIPENPPLVSLLIPTRDRKTITEVAVRSILDKSTYQNYEIIILDNGSVEPETLAWFEAIQQEDKRVKVIRYDHPFNYSAINNFGVQHAQGSLIGLVNNDVEVISPDWLTEMVRQVSRKEIGCVGAKLYYSNDTLQHGGVILGIGGVANHSHKHSKRDSPGYFARLIVTQNFSAVTAACLLVRREVYEQVEGLDEDNLKVAFNDVDFCLKVREAGYRNLWTPYAELYHHESISRGSEDTPEKQTRFRKEVEFMQSKWGDALKLDPYYSPNLTKDREDFSI
nr:glycosyltransferase family 2 protein [Acidithiobacillus montserratensis]